MTQKAYDSLVEKVRDAALVQSISGLLGWDQETMMPSDGAEHRSKQMALLAGLFHERITSKEVASMLGEVETSSWLTSAPQHAQANVREIRRVHDRATKVPRALVEEIAKTVPVSQHAWAKARKASSFAEFKPHL